MDRKFAHFYSQHQRQLIRVIDDCGCLEDLIIELAVQEEGRSMLTREDIKNIRRAGSDHKTKIGRFFDILHSKPEVFNRFEKAAIAVEQEGLIEIINRYIEACKANPVDLTIPNDPGADADFDGPDTSQSSASKKPVHQNNYVFNNQNNQGRMIGGIVYGTVYQGDTYTNSPVNHGSIGEQVINYGSGNIHRGNPRN